MTKLSKVTAVTTEKKMFADLIMWAIGYSVFPFKLELSHIFSMELFADCRVKGRVWRVALQTAHCCVGTMLLSSHISLPKQQQRAPPAHRALTLLLI